MADGATLTDLRTEPSEAHLARVPPRPATSMPAPRVMSMIVHERARIEAGRTDRLPMVIIDTHLARGASHGGTTFHDRGGPYGMTKGAKRAIAVDITGLELT